MKPSPAAPRRRPFSTLRAFLESEAAGGLVLMAAAGLALLAANAPTASLYLSALHAKLGPLSLQHWINDALMAVFFLLVGLEIKRELLDGQLSTWSRRALPGLAAAGGMAVPALVFLAFNRHDPETLRGWAIPSATDIAFALGVLALLGSRVPASLKIFLTALAILDDLGAVVIIALFYAKNLSLADLAGAGAVFAALLAANRAGIVRLWPYLLLGAALWVLVFRSGVHATVAGVLLAAAIPLRRSPGRPDDEAASPLHRLEHAIQPWVAFGIMPLFGFANAGVSFSGLTAGAFLDPLTLGVALGLFAGKLIGVFGSACLAMKLVLAAFPAGAGRLQFLGVAALCGIGFTMSLFIGLLAFAGNPRLQEEMKIGILCGSLTSGLAGWALLRVASRKKDSPGGS